MEVILVALAAAHEGEEFVIALPAVMLAGAFFLMRWANQGDEDKPSDDSAEAASEAEPASAAEPESAADVVGSTQE